MALILPKGIVINSPEIEGSIKKINTKPLDLADIAKFWKVYTTTKRRLLDPTAARLENYWWRIWGSRRRELNGVTVARLFAYISDGQSFVPLRGPANRDEGSPPLNRTTRHEPGAASSTTLHRPSQGRLSTTSSTTSKAPVVIPHPILKQTGGPPTTGPRPTARFISPHEFEDGAALNSSVSPNLHVVIQPPSLDSQNSKTDTKAVAAGGSKKGQQFVTSTAAKKKRQSALKSPTGKIRPALSEELQSKGKAASKFQTKLSPGHRAARSPRKRQPSKPADPKRAPPRKSIPKTLSKEPTTDMTALGDSGPFIRLRMVENLQVPAQDFTQEELHELKLQRILLEEANSRVKKNSLATSQNTLKETQEGSQTPHKPPRTKFQEPDTGAMRLLTHNFKRNSLGDPEEAKQTEMFAKRPVPSISRTTAAAFREGSLASGRSQLTLLLESAKVRT